MGGSLRACVATPAGPWLRGRGAAVEGRKICVEMIQSLAEIPGAADFHVIAPLQSSEAFAAVSEESGVLNRRESVAE